MGYQANITIFIDQLDLMAQDSEFGKKISDAAVTKSVSSEYRKKPYPFYTKDASGDEILAGMVNAVHHSHDDITVTTDYAPDRDCANITLYLDATHRIAEDTQFGARLAEAIETKAKIGPLDSYAERFNAKSDRCVCSAGTVIAVYKGDTELTIETGGNTGKVVNSQKSKGYRL